MESGGCAFFSACGGTGRRVKMPQKMPQGDEAGVGAENERYAAAGALRNNQEETATNRQKLLRLRPKWL
jgi:hypothetical protein